MNSKVKFSERLRYRFDQTMSAGPAALIGWLGVVSFILILLFGAILAITGIGPGGDGTLSFPEAVWQSLMRTLDAGTMGADSGWGFRIVMLMVTLAGIFVVSTLIGVLSSGIEGKLDELRKGRSRVLESEHTVILNWSDSIFDVISELTIANESRRRPRIVIMANRDKVEMEDEIAAKIANLRNTKVVCRSGDPTDLYDLSIANLQASRSIVILSPEGDDPDSAVIKTILAITQDPSRRQAKYRIAAELRDTASAELARTVGGEEVQLVLADDLISRIVVHSSRQPGLSAVYTELLDFDGSEIYTIDEPKMIGKSMAAAAFSYESSTLIGYVSPEGQVELNPSPTHVLAEGSKLILIAEDDDKIAIKPFAGQVNQAALRQAAAVEVVPERTLMLGWNRRAPIIASELARYVAPGSELTIVADTPDFLNEADMIQIDEKRLGVALRQADSSSRKVLDGLDVTSFDHILVLGYNEVLSAQAADTKTLVTLLHLRKIAEKAGQSNGVVSEMIDVRNRELAEVSRADDFVVSNKLVSLMLTQAAENELMSAIFDSLLDENGSELYLRPASDFVAIGESVDFYTVSISAMKQGATAIGYRQLRAGANNVRNLGGVRINPNKSEKIVFEAQDRVVVLAAS